jgi:phosphoribosylanthranilate isomerase
MQRTRIKICGITRTEDALEAERLGADALGLNFYAKSSRVLGANQAAVIAASLSPLTSLVGLFVNSDREFVQSIIDQVPLNLLQFHGDEDADFCNSFQLPWIKALRVKDARLVIEQAALYADARGVLLDSYVAGEPGGTGTSFDWNCIPTLRKPFILAGGLDAENVGEAIAKVRPYAVDVSSGVESSPGIKDAVKMRAFIEAVGRADFSVGEQS